MHSSSEPIFFIVIPSFNQAKFLKKAIDSVLAQSQKNVFLRVNDGGSTDSSVEILQSYGKKISWISQKDEGQTQAINNGIDFFQKKIKAEKIDPDNVIFTYLNSDDFYFHEDVFLNVAHAFEREKNKAWLVGDAMIVNSDGKEIQSSIRWYKKIMRNLFGIKILTFLNPIPQPSTFLKWSVVEKIGKLNQKLRYTMDYEYWLRTAKIFGEPISVDSELACFRIHQDSKGGSQFQQQFQEELEVAQHQQVGSVALLFHRLHVVLIVTIYSILK